LLPGPFEVGVLTNLAILVEAGDGTGDGFCYGLCYGLGFVLVDSDDPSTKCNVSGFGNIGGFPFGKEHVPLERSMCCMVVVSSELTVAFHWKGWSITLFEMLTRLRMELLSMSLLFQVIAADR
jgi:hypothetical protein